VDEKGFLHLPLAGDVLVAGQSLADAEKNVEKAMKPVDRVARVALLAGDLLGHRASVIGAVMTPGRVEVTEGSRVADLIALAGGVMREVVDGEVAELADLDGARLVRDGRAVPVSLPLALKGDPAHNVRVRAGDHLYVPPRLGARVAILGKVGTPR